MAAGQTGQRGNRVKVTLMCVNVGQGRVAARSRSMAVHSVLVLVLKSTAAHHVRSTTSRPNAVITIAIRLRYDYDPTTTYRARLLPFDASKNEHVNFSS